MQTCSIDTYENILFNPSLSINQKRHVGKEATVEELYDNDLKKVVARKVIDKNGTTNYVSI